MSSAAGEGRRLLHHGTPSAAAIHHSATTHLWLPGASQCASSGVEHSHQRLAGAAGHHEHAGAGGEQGTVTHGCGMASE